MIFIYSLPGIIQLFFSRLRDNIEELRRSFAPKESALEDLQQSIVEKEQVKEQAENFQVLFFIYFSLKLSS